MVRLPTLAGGRPCHSFSCTQKLGLPREISLETSHMYRDFICQIMKAKDFPESCPLDVEPKYSAYSSWKSIYAKKPILQSGINSTCHWWRQGHQPMAICLAQWLSPAWPSSQDHSFGQRPLTPSPIYVGPWVQSMRWFTYGTFWKRRSTGTAM